MAPIVRPVGNKPEIIAPLLDRGAWGVQVPHVNTADEARAAVDAVKSACSTSTAALGRLLQHGSDAYLKTMHEAARVAQ
jgi:2-keto-3-deoxy-L-rhamnonate aldolase RhmA